MKIPRPFFAVLACLLLVSCAAPTAAPTPTPTVTAMPSPTVEIYPEWEHYYSEAGLTGTFVLYDLKNNRYLRYNPDRCSQRFLPASTFKIMNALVGLETGVIPDADYVIPWDGTASPIESWNKDHTLRSAMKESVVWYYQELARQVGHDRMQTALNAVGYGNGDISGQQDTFWLEGGLRISPDEQIAFLKRLYQNDLPFSQRTMDIVKEILIIEQTDNYTLRAKTGWVTRVPPQIGWYVGYLETADNVYFFANNYESATPGPDFGAARESITRSILKELQLLP